jgi:tetratricopeptide (TPR) repeat protein
MAKQVPRQKPVINNRKRVSGDWFLQPPGVYLIFLAVLLVVYGQIVVFLPGKLDEDLLIIRPLSLLKDWSNLPMIFSKDPFFNDHGNFYRPLQTLTFMVDAQLFFETGSVVHITNLLIHFATGCALFSLLVMMRDDRFSALLLTLLFLVSPLFVHSVAWAPARGDLLIGFTGILCLIFFIRFLQGKMIRDSLWLMLCYLLALFSKETAIMILPVLAIWLLMSGNIRNIFDRQWIILMAGISAITALYLFMRFRVTSGITDTGFGLSHVFANLMTLPELVAKFFLPFRLSPMPAFSWFNTLAGMVLTLVLISPFFFIKSAAGRYGFGLIWFSLFLLPGLLYTHFLGRDSYDYLEQRAYLPMAGIILSLHMIIPASWSHRQKNLKFLMLPLIFYGFFSWIYAGNYKDPFLFFDRAVATNPGSAMAVHNRGCLKNEVEDYQGALADFETAIRLKPDYASAWQNKGIALVHLKDNSGAREAFLQALRINPSFTEALIMLGSVAAELDNNEESLEAYSKALKINPTLGLAYARRGFIWLKKQDYQAALKEFDLALKYDPEDVFALINRGRVRYLLHDTTGACLDWEKASFKGNPEALQLAGKYCR